MRLSAVWSRAWQTSFSTTAPERRPKPSTRSAKSWNISAKPRKAFVNASLKFPENQRFEIVGFLALFGRILWFDPRREYSSIPTASSRSRRAQGLSRLAASSRPPAGLGLDWPEHGGILDRIGAGGAHHIIWKFKPLVLGEIHAAGDSELRGAKIRRPFRDAVGHGQTTMS